MTYSLQGAVSAHLSNASATAPVMLMLFWAVYLLLAPTIGFSWIDSWHNEQRAVQVVLLSLTAFVYAAMATAGPEPWRTRLQPPWWWLAFLGLGVASAIGSHIPFAAFAEVALFAMLGTLVLLTAALTASHPAVMAQAARYCALLLAVAHVLAVTVRYFAAINLGNGVDLSVFMLGYANPRFASALYAVLMPFVAAIAIDQQERPSLRAAAFSALCLLWTINIGLGTRGIWFAYGIAVPALLLLIGGRKMIRIGGAIILSAAIGVVLFIALISGSATESVTAAGFQLSSERLQTLTSREVLWALSWEAIVKHPLLGLGPMNFVALRSHVGAHPHSWPLQIGMEWGLLALALLMFALMMAARCFRRARASDPGFSIEAFVAVAVALAYGLVDGNLVMPVSQTASSLALGLAMGSLAKGPEHFLWRTGRSVAFSTITLAATIVVCVYALQSLADQPRTTAAFRAENPQAWLVPRFWENGIAVTISPSLRTSK